MPRVGVCLLAIACALLAPGVLEARLPLGKPPPSAAHEEPPKPDKPPKTTSGSSWLSAVDGVCDDALSARKALLASVSLNPSTTARKTLLRILTGTAAVEDQMLSRLAGIRPPHRDHATFTRDLHLFRARHAEDKRLIASLRGHWDARLLERQTRRDRGLNARLARVWSRLGAGACGRYFRSLRA
jgi:hypothetical protein